LTSGFCGAVLKVNTKKHLEGLVKDWDTWKNRCIQIWKGIAPILDLISPELPENLPRAQNLGAIEKSQHAWGWLQQFMKDAGEYAGAHVLSMVHAHYPLVNLSRLERGYPKEVGPKEADDLRIGLLDLSSTVMGDINLYGSSAPSSQLSLDRLAGMWSESSLAGDGRSTPVVPTSQAPVALTMSTVSGAHAAATSEQPEQRPPTRL